MQIFFFLLYFLIMFKKLYFILKENFPILILKIIKILLLSNLALLILKRKVYWKNGYISTDKTLIQFYNTYKTRYYDSWMFYLLHPRILRVSFFVPRIKITIRLFVRFGKNHILHVYRIIEKKQSATVNLPQRLFPRVGI